MRRRTLPALTQAFTLLALTGLLLISTFPVITLAAVDAGVPSTQNNAAVCETNEDCPAARAGATLVCSDVQFTDGVERKMCTDCRVDGAAACQTGTTCNESTGSCMSEEVANSPATPTNQPAAPTTNQSSNATDDLVFTPLTGLPGLNNFSGQTGLADFLNVLYRLCVGAAAILAVVQIIRAGFMWMRSDSMTEHKEARGIITSSLLGLLLVLSPAIVFGIIDPRILNLSLDTSSLRIENAAPLPPAQGRSESLTDNDALLRVTTQAAIDECMAQSSITSSNERICRMEINIDNHSQAVCRCTDRVVAPTPTGVQMRGVTRGWSEFNPNHYVFMAVSARNTATESTTMCLMVWGNVFQNQTSCQQKKTTVTSEQGNVPGFGVIKDCVQITSSVEIRNACPSSPQGDFPGFI